MTQRDVVVPDNVFRAARDTMGVYFEPISRISRETAARDFLDTTKSRHRAELLERFTPLAGKKVLEIGSGFGTNIAVWTLDYSIDGYGVEPSTEGFEAGYQASKQLLSANGIDSDRIVDAPGESLPFSDESFDIVFSANVLEHTRQPEAVLREAMRVLRQGGLMHMEVPNHLSYFEGHYMILQPPLVHSRILPAWLKILGRDPAFARTIQTQINPFWLKRQLKKIAADYPLHIVSFGEEIFLERLARPFRFEAQGVSNRLAPLIGALQLANLGNWIGKTIVTVRGFYPLYVTVRRLTSE